MQDAEFIHINHDIAQLVSLGVDEKFLKENDVTPAQARDLVKGLLYLREKYKSMFGL